VAPDELRQRVDDEVGAVVERPEQVRRHGVVHHEGDAGRVGRAGEGLEIVHVVARVADRLGVDEPGPVVDGRRNPGRVGGVHETGLDAHARERVVEEVDRAAVERRGGDDVVAGARDREHRGGDGRLARRQCQRAHPSLHLGKPPLENVGGGVADAGVDVARLLEREERGGLVHRLERVGRGLVDRNGTGAGGRVWRVAAVQRGRGGAERSVSRHRSILLGAASAGRPTYGASKTHLAPPAAATLRAAGLWCQTGADRKAWCRRAVAVGRSASASTNAMWRLPGARETR